MACADSPCFGCYYSDYDHQYGEHWCDCQTSCPKGVTKRRVNYQQEERRLLD